MAASNFWWVQPIVVTVGIVISLIMARSTIVTNRRIASTKATLDLIEATESREYYQTLYKCYRRFRHEPQYKSRVLIPHSTEDEDARSRCFDFLNHYELVAAGIQEGILNERFYKRWMGYVVLRDYKEGTELIVSARTPTKATDPGDKEAYTEFEALCVKWGAKKVS